MNSMMFDLSGKRRRLRIGGADAAQFLQGQCTNDVKSLASGGHCYAAFLTAKGKMRGDADILRTENETFIVSTAADLEASLAKFIISEDVTIDDVSFDLAEWAIWGPKPNTELIYANRVGGWNVIGVNKPLGAPASEVEFELLRIEHGVPLWGVDMNETTIPVEAGLSGIAINYQKGCYIGQETIARIKTYGHVNRHLVQLHVLVQPERGTKVFGDDREIGEITSASFSAKLGKAIALGYVRREFAKPGTQLMVGTQSAEVTKLCGE